ncbi:MAG: ammonium transporter [Acidimicrobiales bacterium]
MARKLVAMLVGAMALVVALASPAMAQEATDAEVVQVVLDNIWVFVAGILVFLMQAGFALVEAGLTRAKNVSNIMAKNMADMCVGALMFWAVGYGIAFGSDSTLLGTDAFFLSGFEDGSFDGLYSGYTPFFFQVVFAAAAVTIASGAMAERTKISGYLIFAAAMTGFIYPMVVHSFWGGGILTDIEIGDAVFSDFAGSTIVHSAGGWAALMGAIFLGPRLGKYGSDGQPRAIPGHNMAFTVVGVFILWFGWFGFNAGSELAADSVVVRAGVTTMMAAAAGGLAAGATIWAKTGALDVAMTANGILAGLVAITAGTAALTVTGAVLTGAIGGVIVVFSVFAFDRLRIDDPVGAISVHGVVGVWGTLAIGLFAKYDDAFLGRQDAGLFYGGGIEQLVVQALGALIVAAWVLATTGLLFAGLKGVGLLRVSPEEELEGLDIIEHGTAGYGAEVKYG